MRRQFPDSPHERRCVALLRPRATACRRHEAVIRVVALFFVRSDRRAMDGPAPRYRVCLDATAPRPSPTRASQCPTLAPGTPVHAFRGCPLPRPEEVSIPMGRPWTARALPGSTATRFSSGASVKAGLATFTRRSDTRQTGYHVSPMHAGNSHDRARRQTGGSCAPPDEGIIA
jgi:hypothetical protein